MTIKPKAQCRCHLPTRYPILVDTSLGFNKFWSCRVDGRRYQCTYGTIGEQPTKSVTTYRNFIYAIHHAHKAFKRKAYEGGYKTVHVGEFKRLWRVAEVTGPNNKIESVTFVRSDEEIENYLTEFDPSTAYDPSINPSLIVMVSNVLKPKPPIHILISDSQALMLHGCRELQSDLHHGRVAIVHGTIWPETPVCLRDVFTRRNWGYKKAVIINSSHRMRGIVERIRRAITMMV